MRPNFAINATMMLGLVGSLAFPASLRAEPDQRVMFVAAMSIDTGRWGLSYSGDVGPLRLEAGTAFAAYHRTDSETSLRSNGASSWVGIGTAWSRAGNIDGIDSAFEFHVTAAPTLTLFGSSARRLSVTSRPGFGMRLGRFSFAFDFALEVVLAENSSDLWPEDRATILPGVHFGVGAAL